MTLPHKPTDKDRELVSTMVAVGIPEESIARCIQGGIDPKTLRKYYSEEIATSAIKANTKVAGSLYNKAIAGDTTSAIWWTKTRMGWKETTNLNVGPTDALTELLQVIDGNRIKAEHDRPVE